MSKVWTWLANRSPLFWYIVGWGAGVSSCLMWVGRPEWWQYVWSQEAAGWASALGTASAAGVAIWLANRRNVQSHKDRQERAKKAAAAIGQAIFSAHANASGWADFERIDRRRTAHEIAGFASAVIAPRMRGWNLDAEVAKYSAYLADLPPLDVAYVVMLSNAYRDRMPTLANVLDPDELAARVLAVRRQIEPLLSLTARSLWSTAHDKKSFPENSRLAFEPKTAQGP